MPKVRKAQGPQETLRGSGFYDKPARSALKASASVLGENTTLNIPAGSKKKGKRPVKPRRAEDLYAQDVADGVIADAGMVGKALKDVLMAAKNDALMKWKEGGVEEEVVARFEKAAKEDSERYKAQVEAWNQKYPDETLVIGKDGIAKKAHVVDPEDKRLKQEAAQKNKSWKAAEKKLKAPNTTAKLQSMSKRAGEQLKRLRGKRKKQPEEEEEDEASEVHEEEEDDVSEASDAEADVDSDDVVEDDVSDAEISSDDEETVAPPKASKGNKSARAKSKKDVPSEGAKKGSEAAPPKAAKKRKAAPPPDGEDMQTEKQTRVDVKHAKKDDITDINTDTRKPRGAKAGKGGKVHASTKQAASKRAKVAHAADDGVEESGREIDEAVQPKVTGNKAAAEKPTPTTAKKSEGRRSRIARRSRNSTVRKSVPESGPGAYTGDYALPSDDE